MNTAVILWAACGTIWLGLALFQFNQGNPNLGYINIGVATLQFVNVWVQWK